MRDVLAGFIGNLLGNLDQGDHEATKIEVEDLLQTLSTVIGQLQVETYPPWIGAWSKSRCVSAA